MKKSTLEAMLKWSRKKLNQRINKPLARHNFETLGGTKTEIYNIYVRPQKTEKV